MPFLSCTVPPAVEFAAARPHHLLGSALRPRLTKSLRRHPALWGWQWILLVPSVGMSVKAEQVKRERESVEVERASVEVERASHSGNIEAHGCMSQD